MARISGMSDEGMRQVRYVRGKVVKANLPATVPGPVVGLKIKLEKEFGGTIVHAHVRRISNTNVVGKRVSLHLSPSRKTGNRVRLIR